jgi:hypothetical protein
MDKAGPFITEEKRNTPVAAEADVVVAGGGVAGIAAALSSARRGAKVVLIEKQCVLGGLATAGLVVIYLPLCDGYGRQLAGGIGEELLRLCFNAGTLRRPAGTGPDLDLFPDCWNKGGSAGERIKRRFQIKYEAAPAMLALETALISEKNIDIWYDTKLCGCAVEKRTITHVIVENKSGRLAIKGRVFIDASGDGDLCFYAGEDTCSSDQNRRSGWYFGADLSLAKIELHADSDPLYGPCPGGSRFYSGSDGREVSQYVIDMHRFILNNSAKEERKGEIPFLIPAMPLFRMTRRINALRNITPGDAGIWKADVLGMTGDWRKPALGYCITLSSLHGRQIGNLLAAGRCMGAEDDAWDVLRVIPPCAVSGEAAGLVAAELARRNVLPVSELDVRYLQDQLREQNVILDPDLLSPP